LYDSASVDFQPATLRNYSMEGNLLQGLSTVIQNNANKRVFLQTNDKAIAESQHVYEEEVQELQAQVQECQNAQDELRQSLEELQAQADKDEAALKKELKVGL
jgi:peptidoglycan hydrolase CwlO-like protein